MSAKDHLALEQLMLRRKELKTMIQVEEEKERKTSVARLNASETAVDSILSNESKSRVDELQQELVWNNLSIKFDFEADETWNVIDNSREANIWSHERQGPFSLGTANAT